MTMWIALKISFMSKVFINVLAVIFTLISFHMVETPTFDLESSFSTETLKSLPLWELDPLSTPVGKTAPKASYIAQDFFPIVTLAQTSTEIFQEFFYIPLRNYIRAKVYFLLI